MRLAAVGYSITETYDDERWVALHRKTNCPTSPVCSSGPHRDRAHKHARLVMSYHADLSPFVFVRCSVVNSSLSGARKLTFSGFPGSGVAKFLIYFFQISVLKLRSAALSYNMTSTVVCMAGRSAIDRIESPSHRSITCRIERCLDRSSAKRPKNDNITVNHFSYFFSSCSFRNSYGGERREGLSVHCIPF